MSYPAACRAFQRAREELLRLIALLKQQGIDVGPFLKAVNEENTGEAMALLVSQPPLQSLSAATATWEGCYDNMNEEEEREWLCECADASDSDRSEGGGMYGGVCDDWEEYLDIIGHDKSYD